MFSKWYNTACLKILITKEEFMFLETNKNFNKIIALITIAVVLNALFVTVFINFSNFNNGKSDYTVLESGNSNNNEHAVDENKADFVSDQLKTTNSIPWVSALFIRNYNPFTNINQSNLKMSELYGADTVLNNSNRDNNTGISHFSINEYKLHQEMKIHISRLTAG